MATEPAVVRVVRLSHGADLALPAAASAGSSGADLRAAVDKDLEIAPGERCAVPTGLVLEISPGWEGQVRPRSGLALNHGITLLNSPGTIDCDYRGEVRVILINLGQESYRIGRGDRIAQLVIAPVSPIVFEEAKGVSQTDRGDSGFGSSGTG